MGTSGNGIKVGRDYANSPSSSIKRRHEEKASENLTSKDSFSHAVKPALKVLGVGLLMAGMVHGGASLEEAMDKVTPSNNDNWTAETWAAENELPPETRQYEVTTPEGRTLICENGDCFSAPKI